MATHCVQLQFVLSES